MLQNYSIDVSLRAHYSYLHLRISAASMERRTHAVSRGCELLVDRRSARRGDYRRYIAPPTLRRNNSDGANAQRPQQHAPGAQLPPPSAAAKGRLLPHPS